MWPVSDRYLETLTRSHDQVVMIEILKQGQIVTSLTNGVITDPDTQLPLYVEDGSITVDRTSIRRNGDITFVDPSGQLVPTTVDDLLAPYVTEIRIWVGVRYWDAPTVAPELGGSSYASTPDTITEVEQELVPVATLVLTQPSSSYPEIKCQGYDRMWYLDNFQSPWVISATTNIGDAISDLLTLKVPASVLSINLPSTDLTLPSDYSFDSDTSVQDAVHELALLAGWTLYVDPMGVFTAQDEPASDDPFVLVYQPGQFGGMMRPQLDIGGDTIINAVVVTNDSGFTTPLRGYAQDNNPASISYTGNIGVRPMFVNVPWVTTTEQADHVAQAKLRRHLGVNTSTTVEVLPNHALESGDVIYLIDPTQSIDDTYIVDSFSVPMKISSNSTMTLTLRNQVSTFGDTSNTDGAQSGQSGSVQGVGGGISGKFGT